MAKKKSSSRQEKNTQTAVQEADPSQKLQTFLEQRQKQFGEFARGRATGQVLTDPRHLIGEDRRLHIRWTLLEDHQFRIRNRPEQAEAKFEKLSKSVFHFYRGTALLYYRDQAGTDGHLPTVFTIGDVHPENYGVMPNEHGAPFFGLNDFDEADFAPFSWDLKRGAVGFWVAGKEQLGLKKKHRRQAVGCFVDGYLEGLRLFAKDDREKWHQLREDNSPPLILELLEEAKSSRRSFLGGLIDIEKGRFHSTDEVVPYTNDVEKFQKVVDDYVKQSEISSGRGSEHFVVKDVAIKKGSGNASMGLDRYFVLIDGPSEDPYDDIVLEMKQSRLSALHGLTPVDVSDTRKGERIFRSHDVHLVGGDPYYGTTTIDDVSFLVRERSPYKEDIDLDDLDREEFCEYARICGEVLAHAHARSDADTGIMEGNAEKRILMSIDPPVFRDDIIRFAESASKRMKQDYKIFKKDLKLGAYNMSRSEFELLRD